MATWFSDPTAAAWVQAGGSIAAVFVSIVTIIVAVWIPANQRAKALRDAKDDRISEEKEQLKRLSAGLKAEIQAAIKTAERRAFAINHTFREIERARNSGAVIAEPGPIQPGSLTLSDATVYKQIVAELGRFPSTLIAEIVTFYSLLFDIDRMLDGAPAAMQAYQQLLESVPKFKMNAALLVAKLDKLEEANFSTTADLNFTQAQVRKLAEAAGYPLDEILKERGLAAIAQPPAPAAP